MINEMKPKPSFSSNSNPGNANEKKKKNPHPFPLHQNRTRTRTRSRNNNNIIEAGSLRFCLFHSSVHSNNNKPTLASNSNNNLNLSKNSHKPPTCTCRKKNTYSKMKKPRSKTSDNLIITSPSHNNNVIIQTPPGHGCSDFPLDLDLDSDSDSSAAQHANIASPTPPLQPSLSPEILLLCGSSSLLSTNTTTTTTTTTPASCYGAGHHVFSGISDKRKCRPRGLLAVRTGDDIPIPLKPNNFSNSDSDDNPNPNNDNDNNLNDPSSSPLLPLPAQASLHWLSSPSSIQKDNETHNNTLSLSPSESDTSINSPSQLPHFQEDYQLPFLSSSASISKQDQNSPFSIDSSDSGNVIRTPQSDSSSATHVQLLRLSRSNAKKNNFDYELSSVAEALRMSSLSPNSTEPIRDGDRERDIIDTSFQFDSLTTSCSSVFLSQVHGIPDDHQASWNSCFTIGNESQMRISWRDQSYEMDESDCCRCLSDDDDNDNDNDNANSCADDVFQLCEAFDNDAANRSSNQIFSKSDCSYSKKIVHNEIGAEGKGQVNYPSGTNQLSCSLAESISTDGGSVLASTDSDWGFCYKNELFQV